MWLFTVLGFYSVSVIASSNKACVRARLTKHLQALQERFPRLDRCEIMITESCDYRYRMLVPRRVWESVVLELVREQTWGNFKKEVANVWGHDEYERALHDVWAVMLDLQWRDECKREHKETQCLIDTVMDTSMTPKNRRKRPKSL